MKDVRIQKSKLIEIISKNRAEHRDVFLKARVKYREVAIDLLDRHLKLVREGRPFVNNDFVSLIEPEDHTGAYDRALKMLELEVDDIVTLSAADCCDLVQDQWNWSRQWAHSNLRYTDSPKLRSLAED
jgi:hypothetical protein